MHLVRILLLGLSALRNGEIAVDVGSHRSKLLAIKKGELPWGNVDMWRRELHEAYGPALRSTRLPELPTRRASRRGSSRPGGACSRPFPHSRKLFETAWAIPSGPSWTTGVSSWVIGASGGTSGKARTRRSPLRGGRARAGPRARPARRGRADAGAFRSGGAPAPVAELVGLGTWDPPLRRSMTAGSGGRVVESWDPVGAMRRSCIPSLSTA